MTRTNRRTILLATTAAVLLSGIADAGAPFFFGGPNLVTNGDFETGPFSTSGTVTGWSCAAQECEAIIGGNAPTPAHQFYGYDDTGVGTLSQTVPTAGGGTAGGIYQVQFDYRRDSPASLSFKFGANSTVPLAATSSYQTGTYVYATGGANTSLVYSYSTSCCGDVELDNVSVVEMDDGQGNNLAAASQTLAVDASREFMDNLHDRFGHAGSPMQMASAGEVVVASNDGMTYINGPGNYRAFLSVYGNQARYDDGDVRSRRIGLMVGAEFAPCDGWDIGLSFASGASHFKTSTLFTDNRGRADELLGALYTHWSPTGSPFYATGIVGYGRSSNDFRRENIFGEVGARDVDTKQWFGGAEVGFDWRGWSGLTLTPFARLDGARISQDGYMERSLSGTLVPAWVDSKDQSAGRSLLGLRASTEIRMVNNLPWLISAKAAWQHDFDRNRSVTFSETAGVTFSDSASGAIPVANSALVGASLEVPLNKNASFYAGYNGNFGSGQQINAGEVGFRVTW